VHTVLTGVVGSTAYGLARPGSDVDRLGVFAVDTAELHGLRRPVESVVDAAPLPDRTLHEVGMGAPPGRRLGDGAGWPWPAIRRSANWCGCPMSCTRCGPRSVRS
jgi:hypothetical protein